MKRLILPAMLVILLPVSAPGPAGAVECVNGVYRAGCAGANGAAVVHKAPASTGQVRCADGVYRAVCEGPRGRAAVVHRPY
jgi:hypothetical protein